ncbi:titin-like isoform X2 [Hydractinia symbiolongicarpus]|uniref:titin-like isoform X2 n=1 Tax=Hydractinia symbiolongicarpus TaxID=13093 RepID=UPI002550BB37|nr:titin-like isoform X2 [Hydractinia symbiolongicarpus]
MEIKIQGLIYAFIFLTNCLSTLNCVRFEDSKSHGNLDAESNGYGKLRRRRDVNATGASDLENLFGMIKRKENIDSIYEELTKIVQNIFLALPEEQICKTVAKCNCTSQPGPMGPSGPPGPPGPPGKEGERGLGLFFPRLQEKDLYPVANESDDKILKCQFFGNPIPAVRWEHHFTNTNVTIETDPHESFISSYLHVKNITWDDRGNVTCIAESILGDANATGYLTVHAAPIIHLPNGPIYANLRSNFKFPECKVVSNPQSKITWKRGYGKLPAGRHQTDEGLLEIFNVRVEDEGYYVCEAENYLGKAIQSIQLKSRPLQFTKKPAFLSEVVTSSKVINCSALGTPKNMSGKVMLLDDKKEIPVTVSTTETSFTLTAEITKPGIYKCVIQEFEQIIESSFSIKFFTLPSSILTKKQSEVLAGWLKEEEAFGKYALCWKGTRDNWKASTFHTLCDYKSHTVTIFNYSNGWKIFGGYSDIAWSSSSTSLTSSKAFLFSLSLQTKKTLIKSGSQSICYSRSYGPCFGRDELRVGTKKSIYGTYYDDATKINYFKRNLGKSFNVTESIPSRDQLTELEVFYRVFN